MGLGDVFKGRSDLARHNEARQNNDLATLDQSWVVNGGVITRLDLVKNMKDFSVRWLKEGGVDGRKYTPISKGVVIEYASGKNSASLMIMLDMDGQYSLTRTGAVIGDAVVTTSGNKVLNTLNGWLMDVGSNYKFDVVSELQRAKDAQERAIAAAKQQERLSK